MLTNEQMKPGRYGRWAESKKLVNKIQDTLSRGGYVVMATHTKARQYDRRHVDMFKATPTGAYVLNRTKLECINYCGFRFATPK